MSGTVVESLINSLIGKPVFPSTRLTKEQIVSHKANSTTELSDTDLLVGLQNLDRFIKFGRYDAFINIQRAVASRLGLKNYFELRLLFESHMDEDKDNGAVLKSSGGLLSRGTRFLGGTISKDEKKVDILIPLDTLFKRGAQQPVVIGGVTINSNRNVASESAANQLARIMIDCAKPLERQRNILPGRPIIYAAHNPTNGDLLVVQADPLKEDQKTGGRWQTANVYLSRAGDKNPILHSSVTVTNNTRDDERLYAYFEQEDSSRGYSRRSYRLDIPFVPNNWAEQLYYGEKQLLGRWRVGNLDGHDSHLFNKLKVDNYLPQYEFGSPYSPYRRLVFIGRDE